MGESVTEGTVVEWHKHPGDAVKEGETLADVTTDKVDVEVPAPATGVLAAIHADEGATVPVGAVIAEITAGAVAGNGAAETATPAPAPAPPAVEPLPAVDAPPAESPPAAAPPADAA